MVSRPRGATRYPVTLHELPRPAESGTAHLLRGIHFGAAAAWSQASGPFFALLGGAGAGNERISGGFQRLGSYLYYIGPRSCQPA